ncbi:hypothetical protein [Leptolyngbya iicbica]|uniref:hypothetical protein n=1 Tax=Leptolyngbya iicbica TaxID=3161580 RepID=UPI000A974BB8|nr:hypothetical protein [Leptolyngbya sp. LK]
MTLSRWFRPFLPLMLVTVLTVTACSSAPSKYDQVQEDTTGFNAPAAVEKGAEQGGKFNQFFPASEGDFKVVPSQEKQGFAEYKLKRDGETLAMLTINDTISLPAAAQKYEDATESLAGYPVVQQGNTATGLLVNGRYQVKVLSRSDSFTASDRATWLEKFDLDSLAELEANTKAYRRVQKKQEKAAQKAAAQSAPTLKSTETTNSATSPSSKAQSAPVTKSTPAAAQPSTTSESSAPDEAATAESADSSAPATATPESGPNSTLETSPFLVPTPAS